MKIDYICLMNALLVITFVLSSVIIVVGTIRKFNREARNYVAKGMILPREGYKRKLVIENYLNFEKYGVWRYIVRWRGSMIF